MHALFVHGMGRSSISGWPTLWRLKRAGIAVSAFNYMVSLEDFSTIVERLASRIQKIADRDDYILIGHSLGGVIIRRAVSTMSPAVNAPHRVFLLGSPISPSLYAQLLKSNVIFRVLTGDCGDILGSSKRMTEIGPLAVPTTAIVGTRSFSPRYSPFRDETNDGIVSVTETRADWIADCVQVPLVHTFLPSNRRIAEIILDRLSKRGENF